MEIIATVATLSLPHKATAIFVTTQVDRLKAWGSGFLPNEDSSLLEPKVVETEKVLNGLVRALRDNL
jgi:hypothetical protein